jgi:hypothetical protein
LEANVQVDLMIVIWFGLKYIKLWARKEGTRDE